MVVIPGLPLAELHVWGRDVEGGWWGLASWSGPDHMRPTFRSAWVPAHRVQRPPGRADRAPLLALRLPADRATWPLIWFTDGVRVDHLGAVDDPEILEQPKRPG